MRYLIALLAACGSTPAASLSATPTATDPTTVPQAPMPSELGPELERFEWWLGDWIGDEGQEHWVAAGGAMYGVAMSASGHWEAMIVDDGDGAGPADNILRFLAMPGGSKSVEFRAEKTSDQSVRFAASQHDDPEMISYARTGDALRATLHAASNRTITFDFTRTELPRAPDLEKADLRFSDDTQQRGIEGWMAAFETNGGMIRKGSRITGDAIREMMAPVLAEGSLVWRPIDSGQRGGIGFTVGKADFFGKDKKVRWQSSYVTIWKQQPDKSWKVLFDVGRPVHEPAK